MENKDKLNTAAFRIATRSHSGGSAGELMTLYSIVNTLTEFNTMNGVK